MTGFSNRNRNSTGPDSDGGGRSPTGPDSDGGDRSPTGPDSDDPTDPARRTTIVPDTDDRFAVPLRGVAVDPETRCAHWDDREDVIALRFGCCEEFFPCARCHDATADHAAVPWPRDRFDEPAVLCGGCGATLTPPDYFACDDACPECGAAFNPGCRAHRDRYFES